jgi:sulfur-carrier protein
MIDLLYFARLKENLGSSGETIALPSSVRTVRQLIELLRERGGAWQSELAPGKSIRVAINQVLADWDAGIGDGDEVAFFPPVTGG